MVGHIHKHSQAETHTDTIGKFIINYACIFWVSQVAYYLRSLKC